MTTLDIYEIILNSAAILSTIYLVIILLVNEINNNKTN
jgi:hypothetical protein